MKNSIEKVANDFWVVSVHPDNRETLAECLALVPLVDGTEIWDSHKTKVTVRVSDLADDEDREALQRRIDRVAGIEDKQEEPERHPILDEHWHEGLSRATLIKRAVIEAGDWGAILHAEISRLTDELTRKEAVVTVLMEENADQAQKTKVLEERITTIQIGKSDEIASWRGKFAKANIEIERLERINHNRDAFAETGK